MDLKEVIAISRPWQWYKNLVVFIALIFSGNALNYGLYPAIALAFISLCLVSSANYAINDVIDCERDKKHPEKSLKRPVANGRISKIQALAISGILLIAGVAIALSISKAFAAVAITLFALNQFYTFVAKNIAFADIIAISVNFVVRAVGGAIAISVTISPWLVFASFLLALFLAVLKRRGEVENLGESSGMHRKALQEYTAEVLDALAISTMSMLLMSYGIYLFLSPSFHGLAAFATLPFAFYCVIRYYSISKINSIAQRPEKALLDFKLVMSAIAWAIASIVGIALK